MLAATSQLMDQQYAQGLAAPIPTGSSNGRALMFPGSWAGIVLTFLLRPLWQGKVIKPSGLLINRVLGLRMLRADVYSGRSLFDGKPAIIIDYSKRSRLLAHVRDEIRCVGPGLYSGRAYWISKRGTSRFLMRFDLRF